VPRSYVGVIVVVAVLFAGGTVVALNYATGASGGSKQVLVPEVVGMKRPQAQMAAENAGLVLRVIGHTADPFVAPEAVARQVPLAGQRAQEGTMLAVTLSQGPEARQPAAAAGAAAPKTQALSPTPAPASPPPTPAPAPAPAPAPSPAKASPRKVATSAMVAVPKVKGIRLPFARSRLRALGLSVGRISYGNDEDHMEGIILYQSPHPGTKVPKGSSVDLRVNRTD
jgi:beta-lactam-binding protein with PASTA domain